MNKLDPAKEREEQYAKAEAISQDIARYLARVDCLNPDLTVNPIDLLRAVWDLCIYYDEEIERLDIVIEGLKNQDIETVEKLKTELRDLSRLKDKLDRAPWVRDLLTNAQ